MSRPSLYAIGAILTLAVAGSIAQRYYSRTLDEAHAELAVARSEAQSAIDSATELAAHLRAVQDSATVQLHAAQVAELRAVRAEREAAQLRAWYEVVRANAADTCAPVIRAADAALDAADSAIAAHRAAYQFSDAAARGYARASLAAQGTIGTLVGVTGRLDRAASQTASQAHSSLLESLTPHFGVGFAAGIDALGQPHTIIGLTLGWEL